MVQPNLIYLCFSLLFGINIMGFMIICEFWDRSGK